MRKLLLFIAGLLYFVGGVYAQLDTLKYRISLTDKFASSYRVDRPEEFLSQKAIARREKQ